MNYFNENKKYFIDFDGVILDTQQRIVSKKAELSEISWNIFFENLDWKELLDDSSDIKESIKILKEVQKYLKAISVITKIHTLDEGVQKSKFIRNAGINIPIFLVPPHIRKNEVYLPDNNSILIDDSLKNIKHWEEAGGIDILFKDNNSTNSHVREIETLECLKIRGG